MKVVVIEPFLDKETQRMTKAGDVLEFEAKRAKEAIKANLVKEVKE